jgi:hypothetical protein
VKPLSIISEGTTKNTQWVRKNGSRGKVLYMGNVQGPEKVNDTCVKIMHEGMMDKGITVPN